MKRYSFGRRELLTLGTVTLLGPAQRLFPSQTSQLAGRAGWLSAICALPFVLLYIWFLTKLMNQRLSGESLQEMGLRLLGPRLGKAFLLVTALWFLFYAAFILRAGADRLVITIYPNSKPYGFSLVMGSICILAALGSVRSLARIARIVQPIILSTLFIVLFFALLSADTANLLTLTVDDIVPAFKGSWTALSILSLGASSLCCIEGSTEKKQGRFGAFALWASLFTLILTILNIAIFGYFGAELTSILTRPFGVLVRNLVFFRTVERIEAFVVMLWLFPDFLLVSLCLIIAQSSFRLIIGNLPAYKGEQIMDISNGRYVVWLCGAAMLVCSVFLAPNAQRMSLFSTRLVPAINLGYAFLFLPLAYFAARVRGRKPQDEKTKGLS